MAGLRTSVFISAVSFLLGLLFTHWIADSLTLWKSPETQTDFRLWTSATYYSILSRMPPALLYLYGGVVSIGATALLWSLGDGQAGNLMFDGGSALLYGTAVFIYIYSVIPNILQNFTSLPLPFEYASKAMSAALDFPAFPSSLKGPTLELASSHLACSVALTGVVALQAGRWWVEQYDEDEQQQTVDGEGDETHPELSEEEGAQSTATEGGDQARKRAGPVRT
ncbi:hypothetical protein QCA50_007804 [Cerrena zonata]|uniref:Shr3 amino acid permease chaperone n=1 Tax=Cerrena zonata TaxID=2478898 RepID=A0AAW0G6X3_9APHY